MISLAETTVRFVAATVPKRTVVALVKLVPVMVTSVPPVVGPERGETAFTVGGRNGGEQVGFDGRALTCGCLHEDVVEVGGLGRGVDRDLARRDHGQVRGGDGPESTAVALAKLVPVMVTSVSPVVGPERGETAETVGGLGTM